MRVLVDTSVWIDHFHQADAGLQDLLAKGAVWTHAVVIGELAAGRLTHRADVLEYMCRLPRAGEIDLREGLHLLESHALHGRGLSWSDVQLLGAARTGHLSIWTRDRLLNGAARQLQLLRN